MSDDTTEMSVPTVSDHSADSLAERARVCPSCGAFNVTRREVCRRCAVDLETGATLPWPEPDPDPATVATPLIERPHPRRWLWALASVLVVSGIVLLGLVLAQVGPFADGPSVPEAAFDPQRYTDDPATVTITDIATVSTRPPDEDRSYVAVRMVDDDPATAWRSDGLQDQLSEDDPLEIIDLILEEPAWVDEVLLRNGDQIDLAAYEEEGRLRQVRAVFDGGVAYLLNLLDDGRGQQAIELPAPVLTTMVRFEVLDIFPGSERDGVSVSDLELVGWIALPGDEELARERADALPADVPRMRP